MATVVLLPAAIARLPFAFILASGPIAFYGLRICSFWLASATNRCHRA